MSNNYLQFSEIISNITNEEKEWLDKIFKEPPKQTAYLEYENWWPPFCFKFENKHSSLWLYSEENANIDILADIIQKFLAKFRPTEFFTLTWAETCDKLRVGEFSGGAVFITAQEIKWNTSWLDDEVKKFKERNV